jgi:hypothetical protein
MRPPQMQRGPGGGPSAVISTKTIAAKGNPAAKFVKSGRRIELRDVADCRPLKALRWAPHRRSRRA